MADPETGERSGRDSSGASLLYVTCPTEEEARVIARTLVGEHVVACANIIAGMRSVYRWQGEIAEDAETVLLLKTGTERVPQVIERVRALHSYTVPCIVELPLARGNPDYLEWIAAETSDRAV
jgi:periplasmic divalent cation tolerance protein